MATTSDVESGAASASSAKFVAQLFSSCFIAVVVIVVVALAATGTFASGSSAGSEAEGAFTDTGSNLTKRCVDASGPCTLTEYAKGPFGDVLIMRHALAPGGGDPSNFNLNDCTTQRNLGTDGRQQSKDIGNRLAAALINDGLLRSQIYSSQWCRCKDTADLMSQALTASSLSSSSFSVVEEWGLNSFYQPELGFTRAMCVDRLNTALLKDLRESREVRGGKLVQTLLVSHYVTVQAVTGSTVESGGIMAYDTVTKESRRITLD